MRNWDDHQLILAIHRHGTLRAAGVALSVTHTTIARRLNALETSEPAPLFLRDGRSLRTTDYGLERVVIAEKIERLDFEADRVRKRLGDGLSGPISLSIPPAVLEYLLLDDINSFIVKHPDIDLSVVGTEQLADLDRGEADVVIRGQESPPDHLIGRRIATIGLRYYAHRDYLARTAFDERIWITPSADPGWISETPFPDRPSGLVIHDIQSRFLALKAGHGMSRAACFMADPDPDLVRLDDRQSMPLYGLWVLTHPDLRNSPRVQALMQHMSEALSRKRDLMEG
ncbi:MAG: LysR family transcriptional regulator [Pseudomonadota bacterium]